MGSGLQDLQGSGVEFGDLKFRARGFKGGEFQVAGFGLRLGSPFSGISWIQNDAD